MKDVALVLSRHLLLVISIFPLLVTASFVISPQVAAEFSSSSQETIAVELKDAHRQSANNHRTAQTVWTPGGKFSMGSDEPQFPDARPQHRVHVDAFHRDKTLVTNAEYAAFVRATGYVTVAGQVPNAKDYPGASPEKLVVGSVVFAPPATTVALNNQYQWWEFVKGANWRHPEGPQSDLHGRLNHPVVQVAYDDAVAYCSWAGGRLPREAEFEYAARRGLERKRYAWGDEFRPGGTFMVNTFQGHFPDNNTAEDGYASTSPVGSFPANSYGLYKMAGNVREWTSDVPSGLLPDFGRHGEGDAKSPWAIRQLRSRRAWNSQARLRGGSYLCTDQYCSRYSVGARGRGAADTGTNHVGFRCVYDATRLAPRAGSNTSSQ